MHNYKYKNMSNLTKKKIIVIYPLKKKKPFDNRRLWKLEVSTARSPPPSREWVVSSAWLKVNNPGSHTIHCRLSSLIFGFWPTFPVPPHVIFEWNFI